ncbi:membrane-bound serine protease (ClpP class) [Klebsormidium nitens]|uniref:Membrane-bound serine protease (ClpP class) n=1 Tax=Klebsormidium nitens TaxID=105231 RepID=A0A1Y1IMP7_KLENI|nr:membrane-bound serine protease (ClpP class) [Klebsormidium nitens]|eukprot:GAQ90719.1 membrane-bound serine protease (ClpP class) [Klebsormidium nitens]
MVLKSAAFAFWALSTLACLASPGAAADQAFSWGISDETVRFAGHDWFVKDSTSVPLQPGPCFWSPTNVRSDATGLHLSVDKVSSGAWMSSEVMIDTSFGYGRYEIEVDNPLASHDANIIFAAFIWDETNGAQYNGEIDIIEASRFGDPYNPFNAQQVIAPWNLEGRINRFAIPDGTPNAILAVDWTSSDIVFRNFGEGPRNGEPVTFDVTSFSFSPSIGSSVVVLPTNATSPVPAPSEGPLNASVAPSNAPVALLNASAPSIVPAPVDSTSAPTAVPTAPPSAVVPTTPTRTPTPIVLANSPLPSIIPSLTTLVGSAAGMSEAFTSAGIVSSLLVLLW